MMLAELHAQQQQIQSFSVSQPQARHSDAGCTAVTALMCCMHICLMCCMHICMLAGRTSMCAWAAYHQVVQDDLDSCEMSGLT